MNGWREMAAVAALIAGSTTAVDAQDWNGAEQLIHGDYAGAERIILAQQKQFPGDVDLTLNLARVYAMTGRTVDAARLYRAAANAPNEELDMPNRRVAWSRDVAAEGLRRLPTPVAATR